MRAGATALAACALLVQVAVFARAYFASPAVPSGYAIKTDDAPQRTFGRLVLVVVDALRSDMLLRPEMEFAQTLIANWSVATVYAAHAPPPTVTLPRIKGLISGTAPAFLDLVSNLASDALMHDSLIYQLRTNGRGGAMGLYGDDTWLRLFPDYFDRHDGTSSFYVADYTEVDHNVTRHIESELARDDWSLLIFHYLGVDHVGHLQGPTSALLSPKLREMDSVLRTIYESLVQLDARREGQPSLLVFCSDHGMNEIGSHGGGGPLETASVMLLASTGRVTFPKSRPFQPVEQTDLAPTLAVLLGVPIPSVSIGRLLPVIDLLPPVERAKALRTNARQLVRLSMERTGQARIVDLGVEGDLDIDHYQRIIDEAHAVLCATASTGAGNSDVTVLTVAAVLMLLTAIVAAFLGREVHRPVALVLMVSVVVFVAFRTLFLLVLPSDSAAVISSSFAAWLPAVSSASALAISVTLLAAGTTISAQPLNYHLRLEFGSLPGAVVLLQPLSLASSSLVEEEHFAWHFAFCTGIIVALISAARKPDTVAARDLIVAAALARLAYVWNAHGIKWPDAAASLRGQLESNKFANEVCILLALMGLILLALMQSRRLLPYMPALIAIAACRALFPGNVTVARCAFFIIAFSSIVVRRWSWATAAAATLLLRPTNAPLAPLMALVAELTTKANARLAMPAPALWHVVLAQCAFFYFGNGNSVSFVDISGAYIGLSEYSAALVGTMLFLVTWSGPLLICLPVSAERRKALNGARVLMWAAWSAASYSAVAIGMREHLFVWSVFSPKYLYVFFWTIVWGISALVL